MRERVQFLDQFGRPMAQDSAHFGASRTAREFRSWTPPLQSPDSAMDGEIDILAARSYDLERNNGIASGAIRTNVDNVLGSSGLRLAAKPDYRALGQTKEWADAWSVTTEAQFRTFANTLDFEAARGLNFGGASVVMFRAAMLSGDGIAVAQWMGDDVRPGAQWSTCFQFIDAARLCNPPGVASARNGIEISTVGEAIAYHFRKTHPGDWNTAGQAQGWERVPARTAFGRRRVLHLFEQKQTGQTRGVSILASVMGAFKMLDHYQKIELQTVVVNSMIAAFIETPMKPEEIADLFGTTDDFMKSRNGWDVKLEGAGVIPLHPGDKLSPFVPSRPNGAYEKFVEAVLRYISAGLNMPYELLMKDFSKTNYSSARAALLEAWRYFNARREWIATYWANPVYELWLEEAVARGKVEAPGFYENQAAYSACKWIGAGRGWVDPMKEAQASGERVRNNVSTLEKEAAEQGLDWQEVLEQRAKEEAYAQEIGLTSAAAPAGPAAPEVDPDQLAEAVAAAVDQRMAQLAARGE